MYIYVATKKIELTSKMFYTSHWILKQTNHNNPDIQNVASQHDKQECFNNDDCSQEA